MPDELRRLPVKPDAYIASEPEVEEPYATIFALDDSLELNRYRWLAEAGRLTYEDCAAIADTARRSPNVRRVGRIAEAVSP